MSDYNSSLPMRTENNGDVVVKLVDGTITSQALTINVDGSVNSVVSATDLDIRDLSFATDKVDVSGSTVNFTATDLDIRDLNANQDNVAISDGTDTLAINADGSINAVVSATDLDIRDLAFATDKVDVSGSSVTVSATNLDIRDLSAATDSVASHLKDGTGTSITSTTTGAKQALDVSLKDSAGNQLGSATSPMVVAISPDPSGTEINNYSTAAALASGATSNHDYTVTAGTTLKLTQIEASASGKMKIEVQIESGVGTGVFNTRFVQFNSTAETNMSIRLTAPISVAAGVRVRIIRTNRENQAQDVYSTISGVEV